MCGWDASPASKRLRRDGTQTFDIPTHCCICGKPPNPRGSAEKLTEITTDTGLSTRENVLNGAERRSVTKDELWKLLKSHKDSTNMLQLIPAWTGFISLASQSQLPVATVRYLPFLCAPPSDLSVIYTMLMRIVAVSTHIKQQHILVTADMAIYRKAQDTLWSKSPTLD